MPARYPPVAILELMEEVESVRMGLWHHLIQTGRGHLSHAVLRYGFLLIELLRSAPEQGKEIPRHGQPGGGCMPDVATLFVLSCKQGADAVEGKGKGGQLYQRCLRMHRRLCSLYGQRQPPPEDIAFGHYGPPESGKEGPS